MKHWKMLLIAIPVCLFLGCGNTAPKTNPAVCASTATVVPPTIEDTASILPPPPTPTPPPVTSTPLPSRVLDFPEDRSLGNLYTHPWDSTDPKGWIDLGEAKGKISIAAGMTLKLVIGQNVRNKDNLVPLASFPADSFDTLVFIGNDVTDMSLSSIGGFTALKSLAITSDSVTDSGLTHLRNMTGLVDLKLFGLRITDSGLAALENLQRLQALRIENAPLTNLALKHIRKLRSLRWLTVSNTHISQEGLAMLKLDMPNLAINQ